MTDEDARKAQQALRTIQGAMTEATLSHVETTATPEGWVQLIRPALEKRRMQIKAGRR